MNGGGPAHPDPAAAATLDAYVDGLLAGPTRAAFEARLATDARLGAELAAQHRLDGALRGAFVIPAFPGVPTNGHPTDLPHADPAPAGGLATSAAQTARRLTPARLLFGGFLVIAAAAAASWVGYAALAGGRMSFAEVYRDRAPAVAAAASGDGGCSSCSVAAFPLALKQVPAGVEVLGVSEAPVLSAHTRVLSARVDGAAVLVLADALANDRAPADPPPGCGAGMHVFRRQLGGTVLYELTPHDAPRLLEHYEPAPAACAVGTPAEAEVSPARPGQAPADEP